MVSARRAKGLWQLPLVVVLLGVLITGAFVLQATASANDRTQAAFDTQSERVEAELAETIEGRLRDFEVALEWLRSQAHVVEAEFDRFFSGTSVSDGGASSVIGTTVAEYVSESDLDEFVARHREHGRPDFVVSSPLPASDDERLIITHTDYELNVLGTGIEGFDVTMFKNQMVGPQMQSDDAALYLAPSDSFLSTFSQINLPDDAIDVDSDALLYLTGNFHTLSGEARGIAVRLESLRSIVDEVGATLGDELRVIATISGVDEPVADVDTRQVDDVRFTRVLDVQQIRWGDAIALGDLVFELTASSQFSNDGTSAMLRPMLIGGVATVLAAAFALWRLVEARRRADADVELALARTMAATDSLTGLLNRQGLTEQVDGSRHLNEAGLLLFLDLDNFKEVNDSDGHSSGDEVLQRVARTLTDLFRDDDLVCRLGGDEFLVYVSGIVETTRRREMIADVQERIRSIDSRIGCSVGWAQRQPGSRESLKALMQLADEGMYRHKRGRIATRR